MITIKILKKDNTPLKLIAKGHANTGKKGEDIVCSAFSFLIQSISAYFLNKGIKVELRKDDKIEIDLNKIRNYNKELYNYLLFSIKILEIKFQKNIKILEIEE